MNGVQDFDAAFLELIGKRFDTVLRLCDRHPVSRHEDYLGSVGEHHRDVVGARRSDLLRAAATRGGLRSAGRAERAEEHVGQRPVHRAAHRNRQDRAAGADERAANDQQRRIDFETCDRDGHAGERVSSEMTTGISAPPIGKVKSTPSARAREQKVSDRPIGSVPSVATNQTPRQRIAIRTIAVDDLLSWIRDGTARHDFL